MSLENWVEKYIPIRVLHIITESVGPALSDKQKGVFLDVAHEMSKVLRQEILADQGYSRLKQRALDMITSLRLEADILNAKKKGPSDVMVSSGVRGAEIAKVNELTQMKTENEIIHEQLKQLSSKNNVSTVPSILKKNTSKPLSQ